MLQHSKPSNGSWILVAKYNWVLNWIRIFTTTVHSIQIHIAFLGGVPSDRHKRFHTMCMIINLTNSSSNLQLFIATVFKVYESEFWRGIGSNINDSPSLTPQIVCKCSAATRVVCASRIPPSTKVYAAECVSKVSRSWESLLYLITMIKSEVWITNHCLGLGYETMVCAICLTIYLWKTVNKKSTPWKFLIASVLLIQNPDSYNALFRTRTTHNLKERWLNTQKHTTSLKISNCGCLIRG